MRSDSRAATPTQLLLPLPGLVAEPTRDVRIPRADRVFVNRNLAMAGIEWVGFDMDYTLAIYHQRAMDMLSIELCLTRLLAKGYPEYLLHAHYDTRFPIRGLLIDKRHGHVLKMDRYKSVYTGYHGLKRLSPELLERLYHERKIRPTTPRYHFIDTLFALCEVTLYSTAVEALERHGYPVDYAKLFDDIRESIDEAHRDGSVYAAITRDLPKYLDRDEELGRTLHKLRSAGKKLFVLTNSPFHYTNQVMSYLLDGASAEYPSWRHFFDIVMVSAEKPRWFREGRPLRKLSPTETDTRNGQTERCQLYEGGSLREFERLVRAVSPRVLYVGDHIYGDILRSKKESSWRTAMIIQELDQELAALESCLGEMVRQRDLAVTRDQLEDELRFYQARFKELSKQRAPLDDQQRVKRALERVRSELRAIDHEHTSLDQIIDISFHPYWGSLLKEQAEMSSFGLQVSAYADLYARRVSSFAAYSAHQHFRSPHDLMPHEL